MYVFGVTKFPNFVVKINPGSRPIKVTKSLRCAGLFIRRRKLSAWLAQSVEHGTLTANFRDSKQSQGRGFEPHIGRTFCLTLYKLCRRTTE